jgi:hypothetical protein
MNFDLNSPVDQALALEYEKQVLRIRREAKKAIEAEERGPVSIPPFLTLRERLALPRQEIRWRICNWLPRGGRAVLAAQFKAGKTTLRDNVIRSLADGDLFLGRDVVMPVSGTVAVVDLEMGEAQMDDWLRDQGIRNADRVVVIPLRGKAGAFDIRDKDIRADWGARLRERSVDFLILDCLRPLLDALGLDEKSEAGRVLVPFDALLAEAGIGEGLVVHHMGHSSERSRGDSRIRDWPDAEWRLLRQDDDPASRRFITAIGRDVEVDECQLNYDRSTRRLTIAGGSRRQAQATGALVDVCALVRERGESSGREIKAELKDSEHTRTIIEAALRLGVKDGNLEQKDGPRRAKLYSLGSVPVSRSVPPASRFTQPSECPSVPVLIEHGTQDTRLQGAEAHADLDCF